MFLTVQDVPVTMTFRDAFVCISDSAGRAGNYGFSMPLCVFLTVLDVFAILAFQMHLYVFLTLQNLPVITAFQDACV